jgi:beta-glucanase (GH16 family)
MKSVIGRMLRSLMADLIPVTILISVTAAAVRASASDRQPGDALDYSHLRMTFNEPFDSLDVSPWGPGTRWIAHTPWAGDFGGAAFADPKGDVPFKIINGELLIEASRGPGGKWRSGLLSSADQKGNGFAQQYGYFEMRARLPTGPAVWPAFWLIGKDRSNYTAEIDVMEFYGDNPDFYETVIHTWHKDGRHDSQFSRIPVFPRRDPAAYHTYGVKIDAEYIRIYFDRAMVWRTPTPPEHRQPMFMLLNLAFVDKDAKDRAEDPSVMTVDYVRAFAFD